MNADTDEEIWNAILNPAARAEMPAQALVEGLLRRIDEYDPVLRAFISVTRDIALEDAAQVDEARAAGKPSALDGLPIAVKDCIDVAGASTTVGSAFFRDRVAREDSECVRRLRAAGAVIVGKANLHEFVFGGTTDNPFYGTCRNPWDMERIPGGSSGGSAAALAAGVCIGALGSDTGGSIRVPAALNGVAGLRPTYGAVSTRGVFPLSRTFDAVGPMARSVTDIANMLTVMAGYDPEDARSVREPLMPAAGGHDRTEIGDIRVGIPSDFFFDDLDADVERATREAIAVIGDVVGHVTEIALSGAERASARSNPIIWGEAFAVHRQRYERAAERFGNDTRQRLEMGAKVTGAQFADALQGMYEWQRAVDRAFETVDVIVTPTTRQPAPMLTDVETVSVTADLVRLNHQWSLAHVPALVVPCGFTDTNLPVGLQLATRRYNDSLLLRLGAAFQDSTDWHLRRPPAFTGDARSQVVADPGEVEAT